MAYYNTKQATPEMKAIWKENIYFVNKLKVSMHGKYVSYLLYVPRSWLHVGVMEYIFLSSNV